MRKKQRESNIELLRIFSMLIIVVYHTLIHSIIPYSPELTYITKPLTTLLHIGVICFVLISGYWKINFSLKGFVTLFGYCSYYSLLIYIAGVILRPELFTIKHTIKALLPLQWWYVKIYLCLYLLAPLINIPLNTKSKQTKLLHILILAIVSIGFGEVVPSLSQGKNPINFVLIYYIGNYIRTELVWAGKVNLRKMVSYYLALNVTVFSAIMFSTYFNLPFLTEKIVHLFFPYNSLGLIINASIFFIIFTQLKFTSRLINYLASSVLSVYLIHENPYLGPWIHEIPIFLRTNINNVNVIFYILSLLALAVFIFIFSVILDKLVSIPYYVVLDRITKTKVFMNIDNRIRGALTLKQ